MRWICSRSVRKKTINIPSTRHAPNYEKKENIKQFNLCATLEKYNQHVYPMLIFHKIIYVTIMLKQ
ncbi:hypothetical protein HZS_3876 [Henneguya salminicola]|nr:hypothetical protein HZS_3876 [Henneguya salminicola]